MKCEYTIIQDSREQNGLFKKSAQQDVVTEKLDTGDYSIKGLEDKITIERKTLTDLFGSVGNGRKRLEAEFQRMQSFDYAALVIESSLASIFTNPPSRSDMNPKSVFRTLIAWSQRYNVHVWPMWNREAAERVTYLILKRFYDDYKEGKK